MQEILEGSGFEWRMYPDTWVCISSLMIIGIYFKFRRVASVRNLDLIGLILFAPGLLLIAQREQLAYAWLLGVSGFFLARLLLDASMVRRPFLEANLNASGLTFTAAALLVFLFANVVTGKLNKSDLAGALRAERIRTGEAPELDENEEAAADDYQGPGYPLFYLLSGFANRAFLPAPPDDPEAARRAALEAAARTTAILAHLAVVVGMVLVGYRYFDDVHTGVAAAALYLLLPYTAQMTNRVDHVVPAALLVWAVQCHRRPLLAGIFVGLASGVICYALCLLPLWCAFYWRRGLFRFLIGVGAVLLALVISLVFTAADSQSFFTHLWQMLGSTTLFPRHYNGFWEYHEPAFRVPVIVAFAVLCVSLAFWPAQKNFGTLLSCSAAVMLAAQFWHPDCGGVYMAWYLPLLILTVFRPNLEDRLAVNIVREFHWGKRKRPTAAAFEGR